MTIKPSDYVGLHTHSDASLLDGHSTVPSIVSRAKELGQEAVVVTDHGNLHNSYSLYTTALKEGLKPLVGIEAYVAPSPISHTHHGPYFFSDDETKRSDDVSSKGSYTHMLLFAKNNEGLKALYKMSELSYSEGYWRKPRMSVDMFRQYANGNVVATTGCPSGELQTKLRLGMFDEAVEYARMMQEIFGKENYFMELMDHDMSIDLERTVEPDLLKIAKLLDIPLLATADNHYTNPGDAHAHEHMLCISTHSKMNVPTSREEGEGGKTRFAFDGSGYYIQSAEDMIRKFPEDKYPGAVRNSKLIADMCNISIEPRDDLRPQIDLPEGETEASFLRKEAFEGLARRLPEKANDPEYLERLEIELGVIVPKNYSGYFLVVSDFLRWAKANKIPCGPGRGSAAGSLLAYCLDITDADPIRFGLLFERFLNPERESPPDIDIDLNDLEREKVIEYVKKKYGNDRVAQVVTFGKILAKNAVKDTVRILDLPYSLGDQLTKAMPEPIFGKPMSLSDMYNPNAPRYDEAEDFRTLVRQENAGEVVDIARQLEGRIRSTGVHAAAVVVSSQPVVENIPMMMRQNDGAFITQWDYPTAEHLGLLKFDFLGLRNLGIIRDAVEHVKRTKGIEINPTEVIEGSLDDPKVYQLLAEGNTLGVFQLDGGGMRSLLKLMKPTEFEDISAALSLYRPGPMGVNAHTDYALRKNKLQQVDYIHPELTEVLTPILGPTFGLCVAGDTQIWDATTGRLLRIDEIQGLVEEGNFYTWSVSPDGKMEAKKVSHWFYTGEKDIYTVTSNSGAEVRVSAEHPVLTMEGYKEAKDLTLSDWIASPVEELKPQEFSAQSGKEKGTSASKRISVAEMKKDLFGFIKVSELVPQRVRDTLLSPEDLSLKTISKFISRSLDLPLTIIQSEDGTTVRAEHTLVVAYLENYATDTNKMYAALSWSRVKSVVISKAEKVYDITVEDNHNFVGNNIILHNCIYQEQVQLIAREMAGYSLGAADNLRRAMGKKKKEVLDAEFIPFSEGSKANGYSDEAIKAIWDVLVPFADYAFNKSHTVAYGLTSYMTAYLKANYTAEYMSALLSSVSDDVDKTAAYLEDCRQNGIKVLPPDVSRSEVAYSPLSDKEISFGLKAIRGIGEMAAEQIVAARKVDGKDVPFKDFNDFIRRIPKELVNKRILEGLAYGGAMDSLGLSRRALIHQIPEFLKDFQKKQRALKKSAGMASLFDLDDIEDNYTIYPMDEYPKLEKLQLERHVLGLYVSAHPIDGLNISNMASTTIANILNEVVKPLDGWPGPRDVPVRIAGIITSLQVKRTKKGDLFAIAKLEDRSGSIECPIFPKAYNKVGEFLKLDGVYQFIGFPRKRDEDLNFVVDNVRPLDFSSSGNLSVRVKLTEGQWEKGKDSLLAILKRHVPPIGEPGDDVIVSIKNLDGEVREEKIGFTVKRHPALLQEIQGMFGSISIGRWLSSKKKDAEEESGS